MRSEELSLHWRHSDHDGASNHQSHGCLLYRLFRRRSKKTSKLRVTGLCAWNSPGPVNSPNKGPVTWKMVQFDDVIMILVFIASVFTAGNYKWYPENILHQFRYWDKGWNLGVYFYSLKEDIINLLISSELYSGTGSSIIWVVYGRAAQIF